MNFLIRHKLLILRLGVASLFLYSGGLKVLHPLPFADSIAAFQLFPKALINLIALGLPPLEILCGLLLLIGYQKRIASLMILILSTFFALILLSAIIRGLQVDCGCFGSGTPSLFKSWIGVLRAVILGFCAWTFYRHESQLR